MAFIPLLAREHSSFSLLSTSQLGSALVFSPQSDSFGGAHLLLRLLVEPFFPLLSVVFESNIVVGLSCLPSPSSFGCKITSPARTLTCLLDALGSGNSIIRNHFGLLDI